MTKPTILLVHGAFLSSSIYDDLRATLDSHGYPSVATQNPTSAGINKTPTTLTTADDIAVVRSGLQQLVADGKEVVLVCHSYGGIVGSSAVEGFVKTADKPGGIIAAVFVATFLAPKGMSAADMAAGGGGLPPNMQPHPENPAFLVDTDLKNSSLNDVPENVLPSLLKHAAPQLASVYMGRAESNAWDYVPCTYVILGKDNALPPPACAGMLAGVKDGSKYPWKEAHVESSHNGWLSKDMSAHAEVAQVVLQAAGSN